ncbi:MAG TPA: segregation/condensation protein A [Ktedonobacteraceae bacterium]|jgi:segregation and condensation protein A
MTEQVVTQETSLQEKQDRYIVHLPSFEGPLDLLLHLIEKRQLEITTISLVEVTDQYLAYLNQWQEEQLPLASMAGFISIAARLLFIKSQSLLPHATKEDQSEEGESAAAMAQELQRHLIEYKLAKEIAQVLRQREAAGWQTHARSGLLAGIETQLSWTPPTLIDLDTHRLAQAFQRIIELRTKNETNDAPFVPSARVRVSERIEEIVSLLQAQPTISLDDMLSNEHSRFVIVVTFLAVLELWKWDRINVIQQDLLGPIMLQRGERWSEGQQDTYHSEFGE